MVQADALLLMKPQRCRLPLCQATRLLSLTRMRYITWGTVGTLFETLSDFFQLGLGVQGFSKDSSVMSMAN